MQRVSARIECLGKKMARHARDIRILAILSCDTFWRRGQHLITNSQHQTLRIFIENEAGSDTKHHYDEDTFEVLRTETVGAKYPYPYGFVPGTLAPDGDAADCFVITDKRFSTGSFVDCRPIALLEQTEGGETDHNVLAVIAGEPEPDLAAARATISRFVTAFRADFPGQEAVPGRLLPVAAAIAYVETCTAAHAASQ